MRLAYGLLGLAFVILFLAAYLIFDRKGGEGMSPEPYDTLPTDVPR